MGDVGDYWRERDAYRKRKDAEKAKANDGLTNAQRRKIERELAEWNRNYKPSDKDWDIEFLGREE